MLGKNYSDTTGQLKLLVDALFGRSSEKRIHTNTSQDQNQDQGQDQGKENTSESRNYSRKNTSRTNGTGKTRKPKVSMEQIIEAFGLEVIRVEHLVDGTVRYCVTDQHDYDPNHTGFTLTRAGRSS